MLFQYKHTISVSNRIELLFLSQVTKKLVDLFKFRVNFIFKQNEKGGAAAVSLMVFFFNVLYRCLRRSQCCFIRLFCCFCSCNKIYRLDSMIDKTSEVGFQLCKFSFHFRNIFVYFSFSFLCCSSLVYSVLMNFIVMMDLSNHLP